jgi:hypothetical protein
VRDLILAGVALRSNDAEGALRLLDRAASVYDQACVELGAHAARYRLGTLLGGSEGKKLCEDCESWMAGQGVQNPARLLALIAPGFAATRARGQAEP